MDGDGNLLFWELVLIPAIHCRGVVAVGMNPFVGAVKQISVEVFIKISVFEKSFFRLG